MLDWIAGAVQSAKTMKEISQSLLTLRDESLIRERVYDLNNNLMELQQKLLEAQLSQIELVNRIHALEGEKEQARKAADLNAQYTLHTFTTLDHAYFLSAEAAGKPSRYFCSRCFETEGKAITLQGDLYPRCPNCNFVIETRQP